jgi:putative SOS response-associated peptidase YedK
MKWGFMPSFTKKPIINARAETIDIKPTFKNSFINKRCIIPATSIFQWADVEWVSVGY